MLLQFLNLSLHPNVSYVRYELGNIKEVPAIAKVVKKASIFDLCKFKK